ncbi:MAG: hypothetical protein JW808_08740 [Victivallales bacterium]|nr:hypothetical protein [Victivallales bacterium]
MKIFEPISKLPVTARPAILDARSRRCWSGHTCMACPDHSGMASAPKELAAQRDKAEAQHTPQRNGRHRQLRVCTSHFAARSAAPALPTRFTRSFEIGSFGSSIFFLFCRAFVVSGLLLVSCATEGKLKELPPLGTEELRLLKIMGGRVLEDGNIGIGDVTVLRRTRELTMPGYVNINQGELEVLISSPMGRTHESLLVSDIDPYHLQMALFLIGARNGTRMPPLLPQGGDDDSKATLSQGSLIDIWVELDGVDRFPIEKWLRNRKTNREVERKGWVFVGSSFSPGKVCLATREGNIVNTWSFGNTILDNPSPTGNTDDYFESYSERMPEFKTPVKIYMTLRE